MFSAKKRELNLVVIFFYVSSNKTSDFSSGASIQSFTQSDKLVPLTLVYAKYELAVFALVLGVFFLFFFFCH